MYSVSSSPFLVTNEGRLKVFRELSTVASGGREFYYSPYLVSKGVENGLSVVKIFFYSSY